MSVMVARYTGVTDIVAYQAAVARHEAAHAAICPPRSPCRIESTVRRLQSVEDPTVVLMIIDGGTPEAWAAYMACQHAEAHRKVDQGLDEHSDPATVETYTEVSSGTYT
ncbi:MAG: hypothetical protein F2911_00825 [Actinobacteria bacterium]|uniref:Unannotated protein n=1 Tax=freshwater metagenome TaxID=449393 RepID=A0A6J7QT25_9ZZZZ|nr:hypothetical protein [Actinomycetota bacterium]